MNPAERCSSREQESLEKLLNGLLQIESGLIRVMRPHRSMQAFEVFSAIASQSSGYGESLCCIENFTPLENLRNKM
ncbi:MAG TPA: hypothetical protein VIC60_11150, partial [Thermomicrobiales bacterium]